MSTRLELCQTLRREAGISGTGPSTTLNQTGELGRIVNWIDLEWRKLQTRHTNWRWMRKSFTLATVASDDTYDYGDCVDVDTAVAITRFARWCIPEQDVKCYLASAGVGTEGYLTPWPWDMFKGAFKIGTQNDGTPSAISVDPSNNLVLGAKPNDIYTVSGDYMRGLQVLDADADEPEMPERYHDLIWLGGLRRYAAWEEAPGVWQEAKSQHSELMRALEQDQLPPPRFAPPLA